LQFVPVTGSRVLERKVAELGVGFRDDQWDTPAEARATDGCCHRDQWAEIRRSFIYFWLEPYGTLFPIYCALLFWLEPYGTLFPIYSALLFWLEPYGTLFPIYSALLFWLEPYGTLFPIYSALEPYTIWRIDFWDPTHCLSRFTRLTAWNQLV
jgi:hypothetical protein